MSSTIKNSFVSERKRIEFSLFYVIKCRTDIPNWVNEYQKTFNISEKCTWKNVVDKRDRKRQYLFLRTPSPGDTGFKIFQGKDREGGDASDN